MVLPCFLYTNETLFPGLAAIPPCLGAGLFIMGSTHFESVSLPLTAKIFTWRPLVFIGLISYSLYLWHWPILAFYKYWALDEITLVHQWLIVLLSIILAVASWRYIETPFRKKSLIASQNRLFKYTVAISLILFVFGFSMIYKEGFKERFQDDVLAYDRAKLEALQENRISLPINLHDAVDGKIPIFGENKTGKIDVLVWGDSHARSIVPGVIKAAKATKGTISTAWHSSTAPIVDYIPAEKFANFSLKEESPAWAKAIISYVKEKQIKHVILAARWSGYYSATHESKSGDYNINELLIKTINELKRAGALVWIIKEVPSHSISVPKALIKEAIWGNDISGFQGTRGILNNNNKEFDQVENKLIKAGARIIDLSDLLYDQTTRKFMMSYGGEALYYDNHHLTFFGASYLSEAFKPIFQK